MISDPEPREESFSVDAQKHVEPAPASPVPSREEFEGLAIDHANAGIAFAFYRLENTTASHNRLMAAYDALVARCEEYGRACEGMFPVEERRVLEHQLDEARRLAEQWRADAYGEFPRDVVMTRFPWEEEARGAEALQGPAMVRGTEPKESPAPVPLQRIYMAHPE